MRWSVQSQRCTPSKYIHSEEYIIIQAAAQERLVNSKTE